MDSIEYVDFEAHDHSVINLCDTVTAVLGNSHNGKSSLIRGIELLRSNRPTSTSYFPRGKKKPASSVSISKGESYVSRIRTKSKNFYEVNGEQYKALRTGVPDEVTQFLGMTDLNIQLQKDVHFMLTETPGERAKILNRIAGLSEMDKATDLINTKHRLVSSQYDVATAILSKKTKELEDLSWVVAADMEYKIIEEHRAKIKAIEDRIEAVETCIGIIHEIDEQMLELPDVSALEDIDRVLKQFTALNDKEENISELAEHLELISDTKTALTNVKVPTDEEIETLSAKNAELGAIKQKSQSIDKIVQQVVDAEANLVAGKKVVSKCENEEAAMRDRLDLCPLCETPLKGGK